MFGTCMVCESSVMMKRCVNAGAGIADAGAEDRDVHAGAGARRPASRGADVAGSAQEPGGADQRPAGLPVHHAGRSGRAARLPHPAPETLRQVRATLVGLKLLEVVRLVCNHAAAP